MNDLRRPKETSDIGMTPTGNRRVLVAGIGNIFMGDDAFGSEVARRLSQKSWNSNVCVRDYGISGIDLVYGLMDAYDLTILVDATPRGGPPGTIYLIEPDLMGDCSADKLDELIDVHSLDPLRALRTAIGMGGQLKQIVLVGCEPFDVGGEEGRMGLSTPVANAIEQACEMIEELIADFLHAQSSDSEISAQRN